MKRFIKALAVGAAMTSALGLGGCANLAETASIYHNNAAHGTDGSTTRVSALTVDAKQRSVLISSPKSGTVKIVQTGPHIVKDANGQDVIQYYNTQTSEPILPKLCAEPAPDVFSAYSASASGDTNIALVNSGVSAKNSSLNNKFSAAFGETAAAIERTQSINLIRESMYRTCERYLNGAISSDELMIQASRDQHEMLAFLTIEQLTAPLRPAPIVIGGPGVSASLPGVDAAKQLNEAIRAQAVADAGKTSADATLKQADAAVEATKEACKTPADAAAKTKCDEDVATAKLAKSNADDAAIKLDTADRMVKQWTQIAAVSSGGGASVSGQAPTLLSAPEVTAGDAARTAVVALTVKDIFMEANDFSELGMACVIRMRNGLDDMGTICKDYFATSNDAKTKRHTDYTADIKSLFQ